MKMSVKDLLKADLPPTDADAKMRKEHTLGSVTHNLKHFSDHGGSTKDALQKLHTVDSKRAKKELRKVLGQVDKVKADLSGSLKSG